MHVQWEEEYFSLSYYIVQKDMGEILFCCPLIYTLSSHVNVFVDYKRKPWCFVMSTYNSCGNLSVHQCVCVCTRRVQKACSRRLAVGESSNAASVIIGSDDDSCPAKTTNALSFLFLFPLTPYTLISIFLLLFFNLHPLIVFSPSSDFSHSPSFYLPPFASYLLPVVTLVFFLPCL